MADKNEADWPGARKHELGSHFGGGLLGGWLVRRRLTILRDGGARLPNAGKLESRRGAI